MSVSSESSEKRSQRIAGLIREARAGSSDALGRLSEECRQYLLAIAYTELDSQLRPKSSGSDIVQQTLLEACQDFGRFHGDNEAQLLGWLRQILVHNLANLERHYYHTAKRDVSREVPMARLPPGDSSASFSAALLATAESRADLREDLSRLEQAVHALPPAMRDVVLLHHQRARSFPEIAVVMQRSPEAVRKLWVRAVRRLRNTLSGDDDRQAD